MGVIAWVRDWSFLIGPIVLLFAGWLNNYLQNRGGKWRLENLFFGTELAFSGIGSVLGAFASMAGTVDAVRVLLLVSLLIFDILILVIVTCIHRAFATGWEPVHRFWMLVGVANVLPLVSLSVTLYASKAG